MYTVFDCSFYQVPENLKVVTYILKRHRIPGVGVPAAVLDTKEGAKRANDIVKECGLRWGLMPTPADMYADTLCDTEFEAALEILERWTDHAQMIGVKYAYNHVHPGSNERQFAENFEWHIKRINAVNRIFKRKGIFYGLEFVGPVHLRQAFRYPFIHNLCGLLELTEAADSLPGIVFDTYHWYTGGGTERDVEWIAQHVERLTAVHVNDGIAGRKREQQLDNERAMPMTTGVINSASVLRTFSKAGYEGPVLCEPMDPLYKMFRSMDTEQVVIELEHAYTNLLKKINDET